MNRYSKLIYVEVKAATEEEAESIVERAIENVGSYPAVTDVDLAGPIEEVDHDEEE